MNIFQKHFLARWGVYFSVGLTCSFLVVSLVGVSKGDFEDLSGKAVPYASLMRRITKPKPAEKTAEKVDDTLDQDFAFFTKKEHAKLDELHVSGKKQDAYFDFLENVRQKNSASASAEKTALSNEVKRPEHPAEFQSASNDVTVQRLDTAKIFPQKGQKVSNILKNLASIEIASAIDPQYLPTIDDIHPDGQEILINADIRSLASSLHFNPVEIYNFVRNQIHYEPYFGAKKGSVGCLQEKICNDTDASSLTIALLRASGIPGRYRKSIAIFSVGELKTLLGVEDTKTVFAALSINKVPVYVLGDALNGVTLDNADFSHETILALEWTHVQAFYEYDEKGGNVPNSLQLQTATTTEDLQTALQSYPKKQWIPIDPIVKPSIHTMRGILVDQAAFNTEQFWNGFFTYQGALSPTEKYRSDLLASTGQAIENQFSEKTYPAKNLPVLPITLPYLVASGTGTFGQIPIETFSTLPNTRRQQVKISLRRETDHQPVLSHTFFGTDINNASFNLLFEGATETDRAVITQYGGIATTPAPLVSLIPYLQFEQARYDGIDATTNHPTVSIGDALILHFEYFVNGAKIYEDEKFSTAGNSEGIFISLSQLQPDALLDNLTDANRNSHILLEGNAALAREYFRRIQADGSTIKKSLDYEYNIGFSRVVVTQNRILNQVGNTPTTFDFKGLSLDASAYIVDYSNRGNYKTHQKDFRLLWGQTASFLEAKTLADVAGLGSIATVQGLQFANAHPETYTVHRITTANENAIDTLALSDNTKANMHADVRAGNTIITPDKPVEDGNWRGILYVSRRPDWSGQYAIGEQVLGNGGWTTNGFEILILTIDDVPVDRFINHGTTDNFIFAEDASSDAEGALNCRISRQDFLDISNNVHNEGWDPQYGMPCLKLQGRIQFGQVSTSYILATDGAKFFRAGGYSYWEKKSDIRAKIDQYISVKSSLPNADREKLVVAELDGMYFSPALGTYIYRICSQINRLFGITTCNDSFSQRIYYSPYDLNGIKGRIFRSKQGFLDRLSEDKNALILKLGFPESDEIVETSPYQTTGVRQDFVNGQLFWNSRKTYYTYGKITDEHQQYGGIPGSLGFPQSDPQERGSQVYQSFEGDHDLVWDINSNTTQLTVSRKYNCVIYGDIFDPYELGLISARGVFDTGLQTLDNLGSSVLSILEGATEGLIHPIETTEKVHKFVDELKKVNKEEVKKFLRNTGNAVKTGLVDEYETSFGSNGCPARQSYLAGRMTGETLLILIPFSEVKGVEKVKALNLAGEVKFAKFFGAWFKFKSAIEATLEGLVRPGRFELSRIKHVILGEFDEVTEAFLGGGLHSAETLENGMQNGILKVVNPDNVSEVYSKLSDLPINASGVRKASIFGKNGVPNYKTFFPATWTKEDIVSAIMEAADSNFSQVVSRKGLTVKISGGISASGSIITGYPDF